MYRYNYEVKGKPCKVDIWDTAGQESFNELHPTYYFGAHVCVLVFDSQRKVTYSNLRDWYKEMRSHCPHIPCLVIANKIDMDEKVTTRRYKFIEEIGCPFNFVSAANGTNVVAIFNQALEMGAHYKANPHQDDFLNECLDLLKDRPGEEKAQGTNQTFSEKNKSGPAPPKKQGMTATSAKEQLMQQQMEDEEDDFNF